MSTLKVTTVEADTLKNASGSNSISQSSIGRFYKENVSDISGQAYKEWTNIPSWAQRIVVTVKGFNNGEVSKNGSLTVRLGTGGSVATSGYVCSSSYQQNNSSGVGAAYDTGGFFTYYWIANNDRYGSFELLHMGSNHWVCRGIFAASASGGIVVNTSGYIGLTGVLDSIRVGSYNSTITSTATDVSIMYQGMS